MAELEKMLGRVMVADWMPKNEIWLVGPSSVDKIVNISVPEPPPLKIGDWPWPN